MLALSIRRNSLWLALFALVATALVTATWVSTIERIEANEQAAEERALLEILPTRQLDSALSENSVLVDDVELLGLRGPTRAYLARHNGETFAVVLPAIARDGYSGDIRLIVGIDRDGVITGVRVVSHRETPGLGDKIERSKSDWIEAFAGLSLEALEAADWHVKKDGGVFDQFTGATITPRAVVHAVERVLQYYAANQPALVETDVTEAHDG
ncbi:MAG: electron transport complex subunit RsxG [Spongiibacteraceae bacterium]|jgi:electron transport complex protein RnfG|nr:electron transport complex subunit RsxG [Spongiibacteraceae bacterium]